MTTINYTNYLTDIINKPGIISSAYSRFHKYSMLNQYLAYSQLNGRDDVEIGPIASYKAWQQLGRQVKKGSKAISLIMPVMIDKKDNQGNKTGEKQQIFIQRNNWFALSQTEGDNIAGDDVKTPEWNSDKALKELNITEIPFSMTDGNVQGFAQNDSIAINPVAALPHKTRFHEIAHVVLKHTKEHTMSDNEHTPRDIKEVEAESCAYILCQLLGLPGAESSRAYVQGWLGDRKEIPSQSAQRIFGAVDKILKAGQGV